MAFKVHEKNDSWALKNLNANIIEGKELRSIFFLSEKSNRAYVEKKQ